MPIIKNITAPNATLTAYHKVFRIEVTSSSNTALVKVLSFLDQASCDSGKLHLWVWELSVPCAALPGLQSDQVEAALTSLDGSPFFGGVLALPGSIAVAAQLKWAEIKHRRSMAEAAGFLWDGSSFDSDALSQQRITGAVTLAQMSASFSVGWVLADNTVRTLNQEDMFLVGEALGAHVAAVFAKGVALRAQIEAATTVGQIEAVVW